MAADWRRPQGRLESASHALIHLFQNMIHLKIGSPSLMKGALILSEGINNAIRTNLLGYHPPETNLALRLHGYVSIRSFFMKELAQRSETNYEQFLLTTGSVTYPWCLRSSR